MFQKSKSIAVLLDVAPYDFNGKRSVDVVKKQLVKFVQMALDEEDLFYLYSPAEVEMLDHQGDQIGSIGNYDTDGYKIQDLSLAFKQTYYIAAAQDEDSRRAVCYITNRFSKKDSFSLKKLFSLSRTLNDLEEPCEILVVAIGDKVDKALLTTMCEEQASLMWLSDPNDLNKELQSYFESEEA